MSEEINPEETVVTPDVNYQEMALPELVSAFETLAKSEDRMQRAKEADAIKSAFYRKLIKAKQDAGYDPESTEDNPFTEIEEGFKTYYNAFKKERADFNKAQEEEREQNLVLKQAVIDDLKALLDKQEDVKVTFPEFRAIQDRWRAIGPVPATNFRNINDTYQLYVEQFYDMVNINRELRDLDFKKNLEAKQQFCEMAEKLSENENVIEAFKELQKLHEQWKEFGPVAKEYRDQIWDRFKAATAVINRKYQAHFEGLKEQQESNLAAKTTLCERAEAVAAKEIGGTGEWASLTKEIEELQKEWKSIGFASKKENQKIYDRFRTACDTFFTRKKEFYGAYKDTINDNLSKKEAICEQAEALKDSTEWKKTADILIDLQKQWKEIGMVPRQKSDALWKRFRAACDAFFEARDKQPKADDFHSNLKAKQRLVEEINAYQMTGNEEEDSAAQTSFSEKWQAIGFVPFKEKEKIGQAYRDAMAKFRGGRRDSSFARRPRQERTPLTEKDRLMKKYSQLEQDIATFENNLGFFARSKNAESIIKQMEERISKAKEELKNLAGEIRKAAEAEAPASDDKE